MTLAISPSIVREAQSAQTTCVGNMARSITNKTDELIMSTLKAHTELTEIEIAEVIHRVGKHYYSDGTEVWLFDGVPLIRFWPLQYEDIESKTGWSMKATRSYQLLI
ncbi:hypothetical protein [uncultured Paraglaciecola sp.]|uniref:hypothetical protein n=1 Tax=uncultured Paraglaciecola sp. TaxID=1765024 RepID=UPI002605DAA9|nr:hypothetical protein [uncultured Paraglaciecola sp.]